MISVVGFCLVCVLVVRFACFCYAFGCGVCCVVICEWLIGLDGGFWFGVLLCCGVVCWLCLVLLVRVFDVVWYCAFCCACGLFNTGLVCDCWLFWFVIAWFILLGCIVWLFVDLLLWVGLVLFAGLGFTFVVWVWLAAVSLVGWCLSLLVIVCVVSLWSVGVFFGCSWQCVVFVPVCLLVSGGRCFASFFGFLCGAAWCVVWVVGWWLVSG